MSESNLQDRAAIHDLFTRYCCALDNGEIKAVVDCFTVDAMLKSPVIDINAATKSVPSLAGSRRNAPRGRNFVIWSAISPRRSPETALPLVPICWC